MLSVMLWLQSQSTKKAYIENQPCLFPALSALPNPRPRLQGQGGVLIYPGGHTVGTKVPRTSKGTGDKQHIRAK